MSSKKRVGSRHGALPCGPPGGRRRRSRSHGVSGACYSADQKLRAVKLYLKEGYTATALSREIGMGTQTLYNWVRIYNEHGEEGFKPVPRGKRGRKIPAAVQKKAIELKRQNPAYGSRRIAQLLRRLCL
ncbi:MAG: helix-turn-helix domain-containing protein [Verrucomicrobiota bacterium]|nr:helix-turn-helix domain-containing protein [Verrucomicrobiota bacterium]